MHDFSEGIKSSKVKYIATLFNYGISFLSSILLVKILVPNDYGALKIVTSICSIAALVTSLGLNSVIIRYVPLYISKKSYKSINNIFHYVLSLRIIALLIFCSIFIIFQSFIFQTFKLSLGYTNLVNIIILYILVESSISIFSMTYISAYLQEYKNDYIQMLSAFILLIIYSFFYYCSADIYKIFLAIVFVSLFKSSLILYESIKKYIHNLNLGGITVISKMIIFRYGFFNFMYTTTGFLRDITIDNLVISYFIDLHKVGIYAFGASLVLVLSTLNPLNLLKNIIYPITFKRYSSSGNDINILINISHFMTRISLFIIIPCQIILILLAKKIIILLFNPLYVEAEVCVIILSGFLFFSSILRRYHIIYQTLEKNEYVFYGSFFGIYNLILSILLAPKLGITGVALATGSTGLLTYLFDWFIIRKRLKIKLTFPFKSTFQIGINCLPFIFIILLIRESISNLMELIVLVIVCITTYLLMSNRNKILCEEERDLINNAIGKKYIFF